MWKGGSGNEDGDVKCKAVYRKQETAAKERAGTTTEDV